MSFDIAVLCGAVAGSLFFLAPIKELKANYYSIAATALSALVMAYALKGFSPVMEYLNSLADTDVSIYFKVLIKALGIALICDFTSDLSKELGMSSLSGKVELAGKIAVILSALPILDELLLQVRKFI